MGQRLLRRWEALHPGVQAVIALPGAIVFMLLLHLGPFNQPLGRALSYGAFWGLLLGGGLLAATRAEAARRRSRDAGGSQEKER